MEEDPGSPEIVQELLDVSLVHASYELSGHFRMA